MGIEGTASSESLALVETYHSAIQTRLPKLSASSSQPKRPMFVKYQTPSVSDLLEVRFGKPSQLQIQATLHRRWEYLREGLL